MIYQLIIYTLKLITPEWLTIFFKLCPILEKDTVKVGFATILLLMNTYLSQWIMYVNLFTKNNEFYQMQSMLSQLWQKFYGSAFMKYNIQPKHEQLKKCV